MTQAIVERRAALRAALRGHVAPAMATPLTPDGYRVDVDAVHPLVDFLIERGVGGLFVGGTTGEGILLKVAERKRLHAAAVAAARGRAPVMVHVGADDTRTAFDLAVHSAEIGADAIVAVTPTFYPVPDDALLAYFQTVANGAPHLPFLAYDIPHMAGNGVSPTLATRIFDAIPSSAGIKCSRREMHAIRALIDAAPEGQLVLAGNEPILLGSLALGAHGAISGLTTAVPEPFVALLDAFSQGEWDEARNWQRLINALLGCMTPGARIGGIKAILNARGVQVGGPVPPRPTDSAEVWGCMQETMERWQ